MRSNVFVEHPYTFSLKQNGYAVEVYEAEVEIATVSANVPSIFNTLSGMFGIFTKDLHPLNVYAKLSEENRRMLYIPRGFGHGFVTLTENVDVVVIK